MFVLQTVKWYNHKSKNIRQYYTIREDIKWTNSLICGNT